MLPVRRVMITVAACAALAACEKKKEDVPPPGMPPLAENVAAERAQRANQGPAVHSPVGGLGAEALPAGHPPLGEPPGGAGAEALPAGHPPLGGAGAGGIEGRMPGGELNPTKVLRGTLDTDGKLRGKVAPGDAVFLVARVDDGSEKGGMILGVKRFQAEKWPIAFQLDGRDAMAPGTKLEGKVILSARVDKDGDAMTKLPGDLYGVAHVTVPARDVKVVIDKVQQ